MRPRYPLELLETTESTATLREKALKMLEETASWSELNPSYSVSFLHRIFLLSSPHTIILDISDWHIISRLGQLSFEYPGSVGAGPRQVATEQGPQEAILKELSRHEPRNKQAISMELSSDESCCSTGNNQARDQAGITQLSWQMSSR